MNTIQVFATLFAILSIIAMVMNFIGSADPWLFLIQIGIIVVNVSIYRMAK